MVGLDNAGKTTILYQFLMNEVVHTSPTIGSNVEEVISAVLNLLLRSTQLLQLLHSIGLEAPHNIVSKQKKKNILKYIFAL